LLALGARPDRDARTLLEFQNGVGLALAALGGEIVGGNLTAVSGAEWQSLTLLGEVEPGRAWTRARARAGDLVAITGRPGRARAGLELALRHGDALRRDEWRPIRDAWLAPEERVTLALALAKTHAVTAAIDISDGLAGDLVRLCEASGVGVELDSAAMPEDRELEAAAASLGVSAESLRLGASDDYELILAVDPSAAPALATEARAGGVLVSLVGRFTGNRGELSIRDASGAKRPLIERGYDPFAASAT
jgi:thiamine-monophosphate kinase